MSGPANGQSSVIRPLMASHTYFFPGERYTRREIFARYGIESANVSQTHRHLMKSLTPLENPRTGEKDTFVFITEGAYADDAQIKVPTGTYFVWVPDTKTRWNPGAVLGRRLHVMLREKTAGPFTYVGLSTRVTGPYPPSHVGSEWIGRVAFHFMVRNI